MPSDAANLPAPPSSPAVPATEDAVGDDDADPDS
jgi:hypothetical protein